jgi:hypothetical protein
LCIIEDDEDIVDAKGEEKVIEHESLTPPSQYFSKCTGRHNRLPHIKSNWEG